MERELLKTLAIRGLHSEGLHDRQTNSQIPHCSLASAKNVADTVGPVWKWRFMSYAAS